MLPAKLLAFSFFFYFYTFHAENIATMFILVNRLSVVAMPMTQVKLWKYLLPVSILCIFVLPLFFTAQNLTYEFYIRHTFGSKTKFTLDFRRNEGEQHPKSPFEQPKAASLSDKATGTSYGSPVKQFVYMSTYVRSFSHSKGDGRALRAPTTGPVLSLFQKSPPAPPPSIRRRRCGNTAQDWLSPAAARNIYGILIYIAGSDISRDALFFSTFNQLPWLSDLGTIAIPAWTLLWASSAVRREVVTIVGLKKPSTESVFERVNKSMKNISLTLARPDR
ncbi:srg family chemoreceptor domain-containing protein [Ditylenchus destructor]|uniref:Serpentine receptor class gamma n=1 Tax=Ditylenchus destructor TaxID=166010 RepID=A0AAD4QZL6_9BILA|nr:srg family chemoreceptor domain-containing protein [Ditylenchus destructor]